jgi:hypothetical protein
MKSLYNNFWIGLLVLAITGGSARAEILFDNIGLNPSSTWGLNDYDGLGQQFATSGIGLFSIEKITLRLDYQTTGNLLPVVKLYSNNGANDGPLTELGYTFSMVGNTTGSDVNITFTATSSVNLNLAANYWVVLTGTRALTGGESLAWYYTLTDTGTGNPFTSKNGQYSGSNWDPYNTDPFMMTVVSVPEPQSLILTGLGLAMVVCWRWRKQS